MKKTVHNFDQLGFFIDSSLADESPLEPGVFLLPAMATDVPLPTYDSGIQRCRFDGASWVVEAIPVPTPDPVDPPLTQDQIIAKYEHALDAHLDAVAQKYRYDSRFTFAVRAGYAGPYQMDAIAFAQWMDGCNLQAFTLLQSVVSGDAALPSIDEMIASLPLFEL